MFARKALKPALLAIAVLAAIAITAYAYPVPTSTGYYLPRGYKVEGTINVPEAPFWPGELVGDEVGVSGGGVKLFIVGVGWKYWDKNMNLIADEYVKLVKQTGDQQKVIKIVNVHNPGDHHFVITYTWDGKLVISVDGEIIYGGTASTDRYDIIAQGAHVGQPEMLPKPRSDNPVGQGYNPPSVQDLQREYLLLGLGAGAVVVLIIVVVALRRR